MILIYIYNNNNFDTQNQLKNIKKKITDKFYDAQWLIIHACFLEINKYKKKEVIKMLCLEFFK